MSRTLLLGLLHVLFLLGTFVSAQVHGDFYTRIGTDLTFQQLVDNGTIVPGEPSSPGPVNGSTIDVNNTLLEAQTGNLGALPTDFRIHTQVNSSISRANFGNFRRWYQEDGRIQVMRLFQGEQNVRSGIGPEGTPGRIEAFYPAFAVPANKWSVWEATYTIIDPLQSNIFQLFHEGGQLWAFHLRMTNTGTIYFARRRAISGLPSEITIASNMAGKSISFMVRANGTQYELYKRTPVPLQNWELVTTGSYTPAVDRMISFRWGMYYGSQAGQSIPNDGLLFVNGVKVTTIDAPGGEPPAPPPAVPMTYYWDNNGTTAGFGSASGVWGETTSGGTQGWSTDATGAALPDEVSTNSVDTLFFGTNTSGRGLGSGTITVSDMVDCADITFGSQSGNITLNGGEIQMYDNRTITIGGGSHTIGSVLSGSGTRTIAGTGTLSLTGQNTFSGPLVVGNNAGGLRLRVNSIANANGTPSAAGAPSGLTNGIIQLGQTSNGSTLQATVTQSANSLGTGPVALGSNTTLLLDNQSTTNTSNLPAINNTFTGTGLLKMQFAAAATARNTYLKNVAGFAGTIQLSNAGATGDKWNASNLGAVAGNLVIDDGSTFYAAGGINTFAGGITLSGAGNAESRGALRVAGASTVLGGPIRLSGDATIGMENASARITSDISSSLAGTQTLTLGGTLGTQVGGILDGNIGGGTGVLQLKVANGAYTIGGNLSHGGGIQLANGLLTLSGSANTYTGSTTIAGTSGRSLLVTSNGALGATGVGNETIIGTNGQLGFSGSINYNSTEKIIGAGPGSTTASGPFSASNRGFIQSVSGNNSFAGDIEIAADCRIGTQNGASLNLSGSITQSSGGILFRAGDNPGDFVTLSNSSNSFSGDPTVLTTATLGNWAGLRLGVDNALPTNRTISGSTGAGGGTALDLNGKNQSLTGLIDGGTLNVINLDTQNPSTLTLSPTADRTTSTTVIAGGGGLGIINIIKVGNFTQVFAGPNGFTGSTTVNSGILRIDHASALAGTSGITVNVGPNSSLAIGTGISTGLGKTVLINGSGASSAHGALTSAGGTSEWQGNVIIGSVSTRIGINSGAPSQFTISGTIDSGGLPHGLILRTRGVDSALVLSGANTYLGETRIFGDGGVVRLAGGSNRLPTTTTLRLGSASTSGILDLNGQNQEVAGIGGSQTAGSFSNEVRSATPATLTINSASPSSYAGKLVGPIHLLKTGVDTLTLGGTIQHTGLTTVNQGTLELVGTSMVSPITVSPGAFLRFSLASPATSTSSLNASGTVVRIMGMVDGTSDYLLFTATGGIVGSPNLEVDIPGYKLQVQENGTQLVLARVGIYASWAEANAGSQGPELDHDFDGVPNGIEFFLNAAPGFTPMPTLDSTKAITWTNGGKFPASSYGNKFVVQTSADLSQWDDVPAASLKTNTDGPNGLLSYTLSGPSQRFVRLKVNVDSP